MRREMTMTALLVVAAALFAFGGLRSGAQEDPSRGESDRELPRQADPKKVAEQPKAAPEPEAGDDRVRPGDLLILTVPDLTGPSVEYLKPVRVDAKGTVPPPSHVPQPLKVEGLTLAEVEAAVAKALRDAGVMEHARVWVDRMERGDAASVEPGPIKPGDIVRFSVVDVLGPGVEQVRNLHVSPAGNIGVPMLGQTKVAGLTEAEAEAAVLKAYRDKGVIEHTVVSVLRVKLPPGPEPIPTGARARLGGGGGND